MKRHKLCTFLVIRRPVALLGLAGIVACGERDTDIKVPVRDSAGVVVVESRRPAWAAGAGWTFEEQPLLEIGVADGAAEYQFVQIEGVLRLPDGRIVVADGGSREIRFFDSAGRFLAAVGRRGDAPGEYQWIDGMGYGPGDSLWVYDYGTRRFTLLTSVGELARTLTLGPALSNLGAVGRLADGSFVVREYWSAGGAQGAEIRLGLGRYPAAVARYSPDGAELDTIGLFPGREVFIGTEGGRAVMSAPLFAHTTSAVVREVEVFIGDQEQFEIGLYCADGTLRRLVRVPDVDLRVRRDDIEQARAARLAAAREEERGGLEAHLNALDVPETRPAYSRLLVDSEGNLWVAGYAPYPREPRLWQVFDPDGRLLGGVGVPERFRVHAIGSDWVLGAWRDEMDVEYVWLNRLVKERT